MFTLISDKILSLIILLLIYFFLLVDYDLLVVNLYFGDGIGISFLLVIVLVYKMIYFINVGLIKSSLLMNGLLLVCFLIICSYHLIELFIYYEFILVVIFIMIRVDSYYFERYTLILYLFIYIMIFSYVFLVAIVGLKV